MSKTRMFWKSKKSPAASSAARASAAPTAGAADRPIGSSAPERDLSERVRLVIESFRPFIKADGGDIDFVGIDASGMVQVRLKGACVGCPASFMTLQMGIERHLRERIPEVRGVENVR